MINKTILTEVKGSTATIWLNRPEKHNALNIEMISGFLIALQYLNNLESVRIIILRGKGKSFCAGADLNWMQQSSLLSEADNYSECEALARCFYELCISPKITICLVHGYSMGGANGFISACDLSIAEDSSVFAFSEVRIGVVPATIAPYVISKIGRSKALELMITGRQFDAGEARQCGLINHLVSKTNTDQYLNEFIGEILKGSAVIQNLIKTRLFTFEKLSPDQSVIKETASLLAQNRIEEEAREGINAFMQKRKPSWDVDLT
jgi:methylglutaconyl-CoA hydratase